MEITTLNCENLSNYKNSERVSPYTKIRHEIGDVG